MHSFAVVRVCVSERFLYPDRPGAMGSRSITRNGMTRRRANIPHPEIKATAVIASSSPTLKTDIASATMAGGRTNEHIRSMSLGSILDSTRSRC